VTPRVRAGAMSVAPRRGRWIDGTAMRALLERWFAPAWFAVISGVFVVQAVSTGGPSFVDARLYVQATQAWLSGQDPWTVAFHGLYFAAPPPSLLPLIPFALLPEPVGWLLLAVTACAAAVLTVRMLRLPAWWLLFPPLVNGALAGNPQLLLIPLLLGPGAWLAAVIKVYALVPIAIRGQWRHLVLFGVLLIVTAPWLPWAAYVRDLPSIGSNLAAQSRYAPGLPLAIALAVPAALALLVIGRERAAWLAVPALWPAQQWYYGTLAMPSRSLIACCVVAAPVPASGALAVIALGGLEIIAHRADLSAILPGLRARRPRAVGR
jgi:hypothetical protein